MSMIPVVVCIAGVVICAVVVFLGRKGIAFPDWNSEREQIKDEDRDMV